MSKSKVLQSLVLSVLIGSTLSCLLGYPENWWVLDAGEFWAQDMVSGGSYNFKAELLAVGEHCKVWVEQSEKGRISPGTVQNIVKEFDSIIYPNMIRTFSFEPCNQSNGMNAMEYADWLGDGDGKLTILLLDIKDGASGGGYVAGYFSETDLSTNPFYKSNRRDMIYIDINPGLPGSVGSNATLAHEMQHMMSYASSKVFGSPIKDTWIDEGLSTAAEYLYLSARGWGHPSDRYDWYINNGSSSIKGAIDQGNNFFVWDNHQENPNSILDDYATVYLFFQWLRLQSGGNDIFKEILASSYGDYQAVTTAAKKIDPAYESWGTLLKTWMAANYINAPTGPYGYRNDNTLRAIRVTGAPVVSSSLNLAPGEGVYSGISSISSDPKSIVYGSSASNIKYAGLDKSSGTVTDTPGANDKVLLTFNVSVDWRNGDKEMGIVTGEEVPRAYDVQPLGRSAVDPSGPFRIDARDMLARNRHGAEALE
jgi:hypothetical protein